MPFFPDHIFKPKPMTLTPVSSLTTIVPPFLQLDIGEKEEPLHFYSV